MRIQILACITVLVVLLGACSSEKQKEKVAKPNILFIAIDDLRPELGCYGDTQVKSPNIDKVANQGVVFNRAYCNVPVCGASRASMLTGILPTKNRFVDYLSRADKDVPNARTLPQVFKEAGYTTISNGKIFHHINDAEKRTWSEPAWGSTETHRTCFDPTTNAVRTKQGNGRMYEAPDVKDEVYPDAWVAEKTIKDLKRLKESGKPFFLGCGFVRPHMPFYAPRKYWDLYHRDSIQIATNRYRPQNAPSALKGSSEFKSYHPGNYTPGTDEWHKMMRHGYFACTSFADHLAGQVLRELEKLGLDDNTIVVIWGDHGWHLGEHEFWGKHNTMHNALRVPLIIKVPGVTNGKTTQSLVENVDIFPTLCALAGLPIPKSVQGKSFSSLIENPDQHFKTSVYSRFRNADAVITADYTYSRYENGEQMLYNRQLDPEENKNIAADSKYLNVLAKMQTVLEEREKQAAAYQ